jgi:hypothetical protein
MTGDGMTEHLPIQRWTKIFTRYPASELLPNESGEYVTYADHLADLRACEERVARGERARIALEIDTLMRRVTRHPNGKPESGYFEGVDDVLGILLTRIMQ